MLEPQPGRGVGEVQGRLPHGAGGHPGAHYGAHLARQTVQLGAEQAVRRGPVRSGQGTAMSPGNPEGHPELQQGDQRGGVPVMPTIVNPRSIGLLLAATAWLALPIVSRAQTAPTTAEIIEKLAVEDEADIDLAALRTQAGDRIKARADAQPQKRPPIAPQLNKLPQLRFDVVFDPDSSLIRPTSY